MFTSGQSSCTADRYQVPGVIGEFPNTEVWYQEAYATIKAMLIDLLLVHSLLTRLNGQNSSAKAMDLYGTQWKSSLGLFHPLLSDQ